VGIDDVRGSVVKVFEVGEVVEAEVGVVFPVVGVLFGEGCHLMDVVLLDCIVEYLGEEQNEVVGRGLRLVIRGQSCVRVIQGFIQIANMIGRSATD